MSLQFVANVNYFQIHFWNQPVLSSDGKVSWSRKHWSLWWDLNSWLLLQVRSKTHIGTSCLRSHVLICRLKSYHKRNTFSSRMSDVPVNYYVILAFYILNQVENLVWFNFSLRKKLYNWLYKCLNWTSRKSLMIIHSNHDRNRKY